MEEMYSKFTRATDTRINKVQGHGLGLSIVKELVDLMGGEIQVRSKLGEGTLFEILIDLDYVNQKKRLPWKRERKIMQVTAKECIFWWQRITS